MPTVKDKDAPTDFVPPHGKGKDVPTPETISQDSSPHNSEKEVAQEFAMNCWVDQGRAANKNSRWWTMSSKPLICPLTGFPINLLPYPPFKFREQPHEPTPHALVDGKFLALYIISSGSYFVNGRQLHHNELVALGKYISRCTLGPFRPEQYYALEEYAQQPDLSDMDRFAAIQGLQQMRTAASIELSKLQRIQERRMEVLRSGDAPKKLSRPGISKKSCGKENIGGEGPCDSGFKSVCKAEKLGKWSYGQLQEDWSSSCHYSCTLEETAVCSIIQSVDESKSTCLQLETPPGLEMLGRVSC